MRDEWVKEKSATETQRKTDFFNRDCLPDGRQVRDPKETKAQMHRIQNSQTRKMQDLWSCPNCYTGVQLNAPTHRVDDFQMKRSCPADGGAGDY
jgi:hypothetical protein